MKNPSGKPNNAHLLTVNGGSRFATMWNIRENFFFAFAYNSVGIAVAEGMLYPFFGWLPSPIIAGAAMSLSSVSVINNALRLRKMKL